MHRLFPFFIPLAVITFVVGGLISIGELLLFLSHTINTWAAVWMALGLALGTGFVCMLLSFRAAKLPPVKLPGPIVEAPVRRMDLGAGYIVGQFVAIFVAMLFLLFIVLAVKHH